MATRRRDIGRQLALTAALLIFVGLLGFGVTQIHSQPGPPHEGEGVGPFSCMNRSSGQAVPHAEITAVRVVSQGSFERVTVEFAGASSLPAYRLTLRPTAQFKLDPTGQSITLTGAAGLTVVLDNSGVGPAVKRDLPIKTALPVVREVAVLGDFENIVSLGIGLSRPACFRDQSLQNPTRLVIDFDASHAAALLKLPGRRSG